MEIFVERILNDMKKQQPKLFKNCKGKTLDEIKAYCVGKYDDLLSTQVDYSTLKMLLDWDAHKVVYNIDENLFDILQEQAHQSESKELPIDVLRHLPYDTVAIHFPHPLGEINAIEQNALASVQIIDGQEKLEIRESIFANRGGRNINFMFKTRLPLVSGMSINKWEEMLDRTLGEFDSEEEERMYLERKTVKSIIVQTLLYICAQNADVTTKEVVDVTKRKGNKMVVHKKVNTLGYNVGQLIRRHYATAHTIEHNGTSKRPHARCGHWHHFWTGCRDGARELILKWVAPTFVHGGIEKPTLVSVKGA